MNNVPAICLQEAKVLLTLESIVGVRKAGITKEALTKNRTRVRVGNSKVRVKGFLGSGGTKEVYDVDIGGSPYAMALCGNIDSAGKVMEKWYSVLHEPDATSTLREMGFMVNTAMAIVRAHIGEYDFPALLMTRYQDHPFPIYDAKNRRAGIATTTVRNAEDCVQELQGTIQDIHELIRNGVMLGRDNINLCAPDARLRLYLNDLGSVRFTKPFPDEIDGIMEQYTIFTRGAYLNAHTDHAIDHNAFLSTACGDFNGGPLRTEFLNAVRAARPT